MKVWYIDSTLRDGEQAPGVSFHRHEKMKIAEMFNELGIDEVEVGTPAMGRNEIKTIRDIATGGFSFKTLSWCRALESDIQAAIEAQTSGINISFPVSAIQLEAIGKSENWIYARIPRLMSMARDYFETVAIGLQDASRADTKTLKQVISLALDFEVDRVRIADTVGCLNPFSTHQLFTDLVKDFLETDFEFHGHNDLGMATANSLAAVLAGAKSLSTTINGLGERAGNTSLDEIVMALKYSGTVNSKISTRYFKKISEYVARASGRAVPVSKPITGSTVFQHESGIHARSLLKNPSTYQLIDQSEIGNSAKVQIVFGKHSGEAALTDFFEQQGIQLGKKNISVILDQIKLQAGLKKENLSEEEILSIYYQLT